MHAEGGLPSSPEWAGPQTVGSPVGGALRCTSLPAPGGAGPRSAPPRWRLGGWLALAAIWLRWWSRWVWSGVSAPGAGGGGPVWPLGSVGQVSQEDAVGGCSQGGRGTTRGLWAWEGLGRSTPRTPRLGLGSRGPAGRVDRFQPDLGRPSCCPRVPSWSPLRSVDVSRAVELLERLQRSGELPPQKLQALQRVLQSRFCSAIREVSTLELCEL